MPTEPVYVLWPREEDYPRFVAACSDKPLPTYAEFVARAEPLVGQLRAQGAEVRIVQPDIDDMARWCRQNCGRVDTQARARYAAAVGLEEPSDKGSLN